jgi:uncharacterized membrane protein/transposase-like protein
MDLLGLLSAIWRRKLIATLMIAVAALAAITTAYKVPAMKPRALAVGAATSQILVDSDPSTLVAGAGTDQIAALGSRARVYAQYLSSRDSVDKIARASGIPSRLITARGPFSQGTGIKNYEQQPAESRAKDLVDESKTYRLVYEAQEDVPIISVYATGPSAASALELAKASFSVLKSYVAALDSEGQAAAAKLTAQEKAAREADQTATAGAGAQGNDISVVVRQLGEPEGGLVGGGTNKIMMILAFIAVLGLECFLFAAVLRLKEQRRALAEAEQQREVDQAAASILRPEPSRGDSEEPGQVSWSHAGSLR